jgi:D-serine deaminase-like pyridoxal phosphate-dependent protein
MKDALHQPLEQMHIDQLETPAVVVDLDVLEANIARLAGYTQRHGLRLRPHTKTHKIPAIAQMQVAAGSHGITVAKTGEAEVMAESGLGNILLAYPVLGDKKLVRLAALALKTKITIAIDSAVTAEALSRSAQSAGSTFDVLVEVDVGMRRCGVGSPEDAETLAKHVDSLPGLRFTGLNVYPGHIWVPPAEQAAPLREVSAKIADVLDRLLRSGLNCEVISGGSTPTALQSHQLQSLTEIRPGTYVFNDRNTLGVGACALADCALRVVVTVVSTAVPGRAIVDGGSKTFSSDRLLSGTREGFGHVLELPEILFEAISEEHGHLNTTASSQTVRIGHRFSIIPNHVCACVNLHNHLIYHRKGVVEGRWRVAGRGRVV